MEPFPAHDLVLEIAADRAGLGQPPYVLAAFLGIGRVSALEIHRQGNLDSIDDPPRIGESELHWHLLAVGPAIGVGHRVTARRQRFGPRAHHCERAADVPDVVEDDRVPGHMQRGEGLEGAAHHTWSG